MTKNEMKEQLVFCESKANFNHRILQKDREDYLKYLDEYDRETDELVKQQKKAKSLKDKLKLKMAITKRSEKDLDVVNRLEETGRNIPIHRKDQYRELEMDVYRGKKAAKELEENSKKRLKELKSINPLKRRKAKSLEASAAYVGYQTDKKRNKAIKDGVKSHEVLKKSTERHFSK